jgi:hypothetical protein
MIEVFTARSGAASLRMDGRALHSSYDPAQEAQRFVEQNAGDESPSAVVILGEALGYATASLQTRYPSATLVRVYYSDEIFDAAPRVPGITWHPGGGTGLADFLRLHVGELDLEGLRILEWPASARLFPDASRAANEAVRQVVQELNGSFVTTIRAGRLWIRNSIANSLALESALVGEPCSPERPVIIAASGPTLEEAAPLIARVRSRVDLWALPSSCLTLRAAGLVPDLVVLTDPGFYAMHHLQFADLKCPFAMPISAARGSWQLSASRGSPPAVFLLAQPGFFESALLETLGIDAPTIAPHGTVAATAVDLARAFTRAPVIVAGLDMCARDLAMHARPSAFEQLLHLQSSRLAPHAALLFARAESQQLQKIPGAGGARASPSLRTYAGWFSGHAGETTDGIHRLLPSAVPLPGMRNLDADSLGPLVEGGARAVSGPSLRPVASFPRREERRQLVSGLLRTWLSELAEAQAATSDSRGLASMGDFPDLLALAYYIEPQLLIETRRVARRGDVGGALAKAAAMLSGCIDFLRVLKEKAEGGI